MGCLVVTHAGVGRHSDPLTGPVLHAAVSRLLNDELKLAAVSTNSRAQAALPARLRDPINVDYAASTFRDSAIPPAAEAAAAVAVYEDGGSTDCAEQLESANHVHPLMGKPTAGQIVVSRATLQAWVAAKARFAELSRT